MKEWAHPRQSECPLDEAGGNKLQNPLVHLASLAHPAFYLKADCVLHRWRGCRLWPRPDLCQPRLGFVSVAHTVLQQDHLPWQPSNALLHKVSVPLLKCITINGDTRGRRSTNPRHQHLIAQKISECMSRHIWGKKSKQLAHLSPMTPWCEKLTWEGSSKFSANTSHPAGSHTTQSPSYCVDMACCKRDACMSYITFSLQSALDLL